MILTLAVGLLIVSLLGPSVGAGNVTCAGNALDWYTDVVGETPCTLVYSRGHSRLLCSPLISRPPFGRYDLPTIAADMQQRMYDWTYLLPWKSWS